MRSLVKYVLVNPSGNWLDMHSDRAEAEAAAASNPGVRVEEWRFFSLPDDTHGGPTKRRLT